MIQQLKAIFFTKPASPSFIHNEALHKGMHVPVIVKPPMTVVGGAHRI